MYFTGAFLFYAVLAFAGFLFIYLFQPETKDKKLEEVEQVFRSGLFVPCQKHTHTSKMLTFLFRRNNLVTKVNPGIIENMAVSNRQVKIPNKLP